MSDSNGAARAILRTVLFGGLVALVGCAGVGQVDPGGAPVSRAQTRDAGTVPPASAVARLGAAVVPTPAAQPPLAVTPVTPVAPTASAITPATVPAPAASAPSPAVVIAPPRPADLHRDLWARMRAGFSMPELDTPLVAEKERFYLQRPEALQRMFGRGGRYLHYIVEEVEKRGMPTELALLPFVESAMNPVALSSAQAAGLWQFIPSTGKQYELSQNWWVDNRRDVVQSTRAALDYLQKIYEMHDRDWFLALASYNWGENAVARAVKSNRAKGLPTDYLSLNMPAETRNYVPKLIALKNIIQRSDELGLALPDIPNKPYFATIEKTRPIDLKLAAQFAGMSVEEFVALNPAHNRPVIAASRNNAIRLPADRVEPFAKAVEKHDLDNKPLASWQPYTLKSGESIDDVARRGGVSTAELLRANGLPAGKKLLAGTQVIAPQASIKDEMQVESFPGPRVYEQVTVPAVYHRVAKRDTVASVAASYGVGVEQLRAWNGGVKKAAPGASLLVRPASTQTVLTTVDGSRQVVARAALPAAPAVRVEEPPATVPAAKATAGAAAAATVATAAVAKAAAPTSKSKPAPTGKVVASGRAQTKTARSEPARKATPKSAAAQNPVRADYKSTSRPAAVAPVKAAAKPDPKRPRT
ncbi:MAG: transglycosylase SLT domain-containing protein [Burkholderiales bacterium]